MHILLVGLNHNTAPLEVRESISFSKEQLGDALHLFKAEMGEAVILSTCNRTEIFAAGENTAKMSERITELVAEFHDIPTDRISPYLYEMTDQDAIRHLFRVAAGLESMIVGESQVLGQVRDSLTAASVAGSVKVSMVGLFHAAVRAGRRVREETDIGRNSLSVAYAGVKLAQRVMGDLTRRRAMLIGAGDVGRLVAQALRTVGVSDLMIANRTFATGEELARSLNGRAIPFGDIQANIPATDILIAATDSPDYVVGPEMIPTDGLDDRQMFIFDLAMPRDVDPAVASLSNVHLFNIDDLSAIAEENLEERRRAAVDAEVIVDDEVARFMRWWDSLDAVPIIKAIRQQAEDIRVRELGKAIAKMDGISAEYSEVVEILTRSIVNKMLHDPTQFLKNQADKDHLQSARDLFRLWEDEQPYS